MSSPSPTYEKPQYDIEKSVPSGSGDKTQQVVVDYVADPSIDAGHMHRALKPRQVSMIAIAGTIGTGLFLGSGKALANGGAVGCVLGYAIVGSLVSMMMWCLGEMMCWDPSCGGFIGFAERYIDPAMGFALGYNFWFQTVITAPVEIVAASIVIQFWDQDTSHLPAYVTVVLAAVVAIQFFGVRYFGTIEFWFACLKIVTILGLFIVGLVIAAGGAPNNERKWFRYWRDEPFNNTYRSMEPPAQARFFGLWAVLTQAAFSYGGMESLSAICLEAENPRKTMKTAVRAIAYRIIGLYILSLWVISMCVSQNDPRLLQALADSSGTAAQSPFVITIVNAQIKVLPSIVNAVILTSALSSGNEFLYASTRALFMLSQQGQAPRILSRCTKQGVPIYAVGICALFSLLSYLSCGSGRSNDAFNWLANITTLGSMISWMGIAVCHIRWRRAWKIQGQSLDLLPYRNITGPVGAYIVVISFVIIAFFNGWTSVKPFDASGFFSSYINILAFALCYFGWKLWKKTSIVKLAEMDISSHYIEGSVVVGRDAVETKLS